MKKKPLFWYLKPLSMNVHEWIFLHCLKLWLEAHTLTLSCCLPQQWKKLSRFPAASDCLSDAEPDTRQMVRAQNKKKKKSGGFQSMGEWKEDEWFVSCLPPGNTVLLCVLFQVLATLFLRVSWRRATKSPRPFKERYVWDSFRSCYCCVLLTRLLFDGEFLSSPSQTIPVILDGKDVVAMARTGSGKTAAFLVPMFEKLKAPQAQTGARALILTPTRELALQTMKFTKEACLQYFVFV